MKYEYIVAMEQQGYVTTVNNEWINPMQGRTPTPDDLEDCPQPWEFLNRKGTEGWELVTVILEAFSEQTVKKFYLRKEC